MRRALERVRQLRFGEPEAWVERRVTAVEVGQDTPELLHTFLGQVTSPAGREYERVMAVRVSEQGVGPLYTNPQDWLPLVEQGVAPPTKGLWARHYAAWGEARRQSAAEAVRDAFRALADGFMESQNQALQAERGELRAWLRERTDTLCGPVGAVQAALFDDDGP